MAQTAKKKSLELHGRQTSLNLELEYWTALAQIAKEQHISVQELVEQIAEGYQPIRLTSAVRLYVLKHYRTNKHQYE